ncbi:restriction endonuclease subunit S [Pontiellaceae bacterium B12219]|nr:restriction endonuclease subunit S [Pontiellaceae bacterium B12219]
MKTLKSIAEIRAGHPFRGKLNEDPDGTVPVLQMKDITESFFINPSAAATVNRNDIKPQYLLKAGDLIFRSRGRTNTCSILSTIEKPTVCAAPLFQIRVTAPDVMPEYICWFINQPEAQAWLDRHAKGTSVRMIGRDALEDLPITLPPLEKQREITAIAKLADREQRLMDQLRDKKKTLISGILARVASETATLRGNGI